MPSFCSIDKQLTVRLTDSALSRDLFPNDYHCLGDNENRPIKWLAIEALLDRTFLPASDVVSHSLCVFSKIIMHMYAMNIIMMLYTVLPGERPGVGNMLAIPWERFGYFVNRNRL